MADHLIINYVGRTFEEHMLQILKEKSEHLTGSTLLSGAADDNHSVAQTTNEER